MRKVRILAIPLLVVLVLLMGMGAGACGGGVEEEEATPPSPTPAAFSVSNLLITPPEVETQEAVAITVSVANTGGTAGSYSVVLKINGATVEEKSVTLAAGSSQDVSFSVTKEEAGSYSVDVNGLTGSFTVTAAAPPEEIEMAIASAAFQDGESIPSQYTCDGQNKSPALSWSGVPEGTQSFALILDDTDAPGGTFTHWVIFNIPANTLELEEAIPTTPQLESGALQGRNDFGGIGYSGPCPPPGASHHYHFVVYALDLTLDLSAGASKTQVLSVMQGHILAQAELIGIY
jgi:hypothetical protein